MNPEDIWQATLGELQLSLQRPVYDNWLRDTYVIAFEDGCFLIAVKSAFAQEWLDKRMKGMIKRRLQRLSNRSVDIRFVVRPDSVPTPESHTTDPPLLQPRQDNGRFQRPTPSSASALRAEMTFSSFIEGEGNRFAHAAAQAVVQDPGSRYNPLFLYGGVGLGKTHLLHAIGNACTENDFSVLYVTSETFTNDLIEAIRNKSNVTFRQTYRETDVLLVDDIQFFQGKDSTQSEFFHTFNSLYATNKQVVLASDRSPHLLTGLADRLRSRFGGGLTADLQAPDLEHRIAILRAKAYESGQVIPDEVIRYIAEEYNSNVRDLQGAMNRVSVYANHNYRPLDVAVAREVLGDRSIPLDNNPDAIIEAVAAEFQVTIAELKGPRRTRRIVRPRQISMFLLREISQLSFPQIGESFGGRDHTTAIHGIQKIDEMIQTDSELRIRLEKVRVRLQR